MEQYAIYLRKSRKDLELESLGHAETLAMHEKQLKELAHKLKIHVVKIYKEVVSGDSIDMRPQMQLLLSDVESGLYKGVLVTEVSRLARGDTVDQGIVSRVFSISNTKIITPEKTYDPNNEYDEEYFEFGLFMSRREYKSINRRIQRGRVSAAKDGKFLSSVPPYGYDKVKVSDIQWPPEVRLTNHKGYTLVPNKDADVVRMIYDLYCGGIGMTEIGLKLDSMKIKPRINDTWSKASIADILSNPAYIGKIRWGYKKEEKKVVNGNIQKTRKENEEYILVDGLHEAIIDQDTYDRVQEIRKCKLTPSATIKKPLQNPLSGLVYCKKCHTMMTRTAPHPRNPYATLKCPNRNCTNVSAPMYLVEDKIIKSLSLALDQYRIDISTSVPKDDTTSLLQSAVDNIKAEILSTQKQIDKTYTLLEQDVYTIEMFTERNAKLKKQMETLRSDLKNVEHEIEESSKKEEKKSKIIPTIEHVLDSYYDLPSAEEKNQLLKLVIKRIEYSKDKANTRGKRDNDNFTIDIWTSL